ncbi:cation:proton antiporter [Mycobacterium sp. NPDC003323]
MTEDGVEQVYLLAGIALLAAATIPRLFRNRAITAPMLVLGIGALGGLVLGLGGFDPTALMATSSITEHLTELCVIVALMGVGLAIDRPLSWRTWASTWRLLAIAMPLCIAAVAFLGWWAAALTPAAAVLLGAVLAPTDPVLASDVQVEGPTPGEGSSEEDDEVRFALTSEAGINDALAFPFVYLALLMATAKPANTWLLGWFSWDLVGKIAVGIIIGAVVGDLLGRAFFHFPIPKARLADRGEPIVAPAAVLAVYGLTQLIGGYGFIAVFCCALAIRRIERGSDYHEEMHSIIEDLEHVLTLVVLLVLGAALTTGILSSLSWQGALVGMLLILVVRPIAGWLSLLRYTRMNRQERLITALFGIRGIGSIYYASFALTHTDLGPEAGRIWSIVAFTIVLSIVIHGINAGWVMGRLTDSSSSQE